MTLLRMPASGDALADALDQAEEGLGIPEAAHPAQQLTGRVLERDVVVVRDHLELGHRVQ